MMTTLNRTISCAVLLAAVMVPSARAEITVPAGFAIDVLLDQIDGTTPRLTAISNPEYGFGVIAASVNDGILTVLRISQDSVEVLGTMAGFPPDTSVFDVEFDTTAIFDNHLFLAVVHVPPGCGNDIYTEFFRVLPGGSIEQCGLRLGDASDALTFILAFSSGAGGYAPGAYMEDAVGCGGTSLWQMNGDCDAVRLAQHLVPPGRSDIDVSGMEFDTTGVYGSRLTIADCDPNNDNQTVIYQLLPDLTWSALTTPVTTQERCYADLTISPGGVFGQSIYVTDRVSATVMTVDADGIHDVFASGFVGVKAVTVDDDGSSLFVSDADGVYRIRSAEQVPGPTVIMREPRVAADDVHTGPGGVASARILFSEPVVFDEEDVAIADSDELPVPFAVVGSNSRFMVITFGTRLLNDVYTITIADTVVSVANATPIDGDNDGESGGDAVIVMEHRCRTDSDDSGEIDFADLLEFLSNWGSCP